MSTQVDPRVDGRGSDTTRSQRLVVTWQHPHSRSILPVGLLKKEWDGYSFVYLRAASEIEGFRPFIGFADLTKRYSSPELFPLFAQRAMDPRRPDFERYVSELGVEPEASPWEQIVKSGGGREGDTLQLFPVSEVSDGAFVCWFLVHGIRHLKTKSVDLRGEIKGPYSDAGLEDVLGALAPGDGLDLVPEDSNDFTPDAVLVSTSSGEPLGYVPELLLEPLGRAMRTGRPQVNVESINPPEAGWHLRILAKLSVSPVDGFDFLEGQYWETLA